MKLVATLMAALTLCACGGGGGAGSPASAADPDPWEPVARALENHSVDDLALVVGTSTGEVFRYEKGAFSVSEVHAIASASKWLTGATLLALVDQGVLSLEDSPQRYLSYWTDDPQDPRSRITLEQLLSFTAGFHRDPSDAGCIGNESLTLQACVAELYDEGVDAEPGTTFYYGPVHMQVAAAMAEIATGQSFSEVVRLTLVTPLGLSAATGFAGVNPRASGAATSTTLDYAEFLRAQLAGEFLATSFDVLIAERLSQVNIVSRPNALEDGLDWYYGLGLWRECDEPNWNATCDARRRVSSPGAFGWYPWLDVDEGYYAVLAMEERLTLLVSPSAESVRLGGQLRPLILAALAE